VIHATDLIAEVDAALDRLRNYRIWGRTANGNGFCNPDPGLETSSPIA
jgi:hypothetical protein